MPVLRKYCGDVSETEVIIAFNESNAFLKCTSNDGSLSTSAKRESYALREFPIVIQFANHCLCPNFEDAAMLSNGSIMAKALSIEMGESPAYTSFRDGSCLKENPFFIEEEFCIALGLYIDDFELANPLGTKKKNTICVPFTGHSTICIQSILCKNSVVKEHGYGKILNPLMQDLVTLEEQSLYLQQLGASI